MKFVAYVLLVQMLLLGGCASKKYPRQTIAQMEARVSAIERQSSYQRSATAVLEEKLSTATDRAQIAEQNARAALERHEKELAGARAEVATVHTAITRITATLGHAQGEGAAIVQVFYATDRAGTRDPHPPVAFGSNRGGMSYGLANVSIPAGHAPDSVETPAWYRFEFSASASKHVVALAPIMPKSRADFFSILQSRLAASRSKEAFVFIHGFNVTFEEALARTAALAFALQPYDAAPIMYSWPCRGGAFDVAAYYRDEQQVDWTALHLRAFLEDVVRESGATAVNVLAHGIGGRILSFALRDMGKEGHLLGLKTIALAAPDIDTELFKNIASEIRKSARNITLYTSATDEALAWSQRAHKYPRAGQAGAEILVVPGVVDTIDMTGVDTSLRGFPFGKVSLIRDLLDVFNGLAAPRQGLRELRCPAGRYWRFSASQ